MCGGGVGGEETQGGLSSSPGKGGKSHLRGLTCNTALHEHVTVHSSNCSQQFHPEVCTLDFLLTPQVTHIQSSRLRQVCKTESQKQLKCPSRTI